MLFLIEYDREHGAVVSLQTFAVNERQVAEEVRLELELALAREKTEREVVLFEAESEEALRLTHRRYFEELADLAHEAGQSR